MKTLNNIYFVSVKRLSLLKNVVLCLIMSFSFVTSSFCGGPFTKNISPSLNYTYVRDNTGQYSHNFDAKVGYETSSKKRYRKALLFNLGDIPEDATITGCKITYWSENKIGINCGTFSFKEMPPDWWTYSLDKKVYDLIKSSDLIKSESISPNTHYTTDLSDYKDVLQDALTSETHDVGLGIYNQYEGANYGAGISVEELEVTYTLPTPSAPTNLHVKTGTKTAGSMTLKWDAPVGDVTGYKVYKNGSLYGTTSNTEMQICNLTPNSPYTFFVKAYNGYGDGDPSSSITKYTENSFISGEDLICNTEEYELTKVPPGALVTWNDPAILTLLSDDHDNPVEYQKYSNGNTIITVTVSSGCENYGRSKQVHAGPYSSSDYPISGPYAAQCNTYVYYSIPQLSGVTSINWIWPQEWTYVSGQNTRYLALMTGTQSGVVAVGVDNICGHSGSYDTQYTEVYGYCGYSLLLFPNPASDMVTATIKKDEEKSVTFNNDTVYTSKGEVDEALTSFKVTVTDKMGVVYYSQKEYDKTFTIPVRNLKNGNYIVIVDAGRFKLSGSLEVLH